MSCPDKAPIADGNGGCTTSSTIDSLSSSSRVIPFPMLLSCIAFCISVYFSKYENPQTFVPGCVVGFCSIFEWISWIILIVITFSNDSIGITTVLAILGFVLIYVFNIMSFVIFRRTILLDNSFIEWKQQPKNSTCFNIVFYVALVFSFKMQKIFFCKYFNQGFFKAKCKDIDLFSPFNKISIVSVILNSFLIILSAAIFGYNYQTDTQLFILSLDTLFVTLLLLLFMIWEAFKKDDFFDEKSNMKGLDSKGNKIKQYFPFGESYMEKAGQRSMYGHLRNGESTSNLQEFSEDRRVVQEEPLQKPMSDIMNPKDFSNNVALDRNVLTNALSGAPYVIEDEINESSRPGQSRSYEKNHIQPIFNEKDFPAISENSQEDEEELGDYDDPYDSSINRMNRSLNKSKIGQNFNGSNLGPQASDDFYNPKNNLMKGSGRNMVTSPMNQYGISPMNGSAGLEGSGLSRQAPADGSERTIFYGSNDNPNQINKSGVGRVSTGVGISKAEFDGQEFHDRLYSKPSGKKGEDSRVHKDSDEMYPVDEEDAGQGEEHAVNKKKGSPSSKQPVNLSNSRLSQSGVAAAGIGAGPESTPLKQSKVLDKNATTAKKTANKNVSPKLSESNLQSKKSPSNGNAARDDKNKSALSNQNDGDNAVHRILPDVVDLDPNESQNLDSNKNAKGKDITFKMPIDGKAAAAAAANPKTNNLTGEDEQDPRKSKTNRSKVVELKNIFDSEESVHSASEAEMNFNEISPTDFNVLNQRYEDDFFNHPPPSSAQAMQQQILLTQQAALSGTARSGFSTTNNGQKLTNRKVEGSQQIERGRSNSITHSNNRMEASPRSNQDNGDTIGTMNNTNKSSSFLAKKSVSPPNKSKPKKGGSLQSSRISSSSANADPSKPPLNGRAQPHAQGLASTHNNLIIENFDEYNSSPVDPYSGSKSAAADTGMVSHFNQTGSGQDQFGQRSALRGNNHSNSRSKINTPVGSNIVYKAPTIDASKLKSLEKIYLQRIESNLSSQQGSRKKPSNIPKKKKTPSQVSQSQSVNPNKSAQQFNPSEMQGIYFGDQNAAAGAQEVFDFEDDEDTQQANVQ